VSPAEGRAEREEERVDWRSRTRLGEPQFANAVGEEPERPPRVPRRRVQQAADPNDGLLFACNFSAVPRYDCRIGAPVGGVWEEILNSDATTYGGAGVGNFGAVETSSTPLHGRPYALSLTLPPLSVVAFRAPRAAVPLVDHSVRQG
jgi:hypothetical protein